LALLDDCEHIFLFDDDTFPKVDSWFTPYVFSGVNHLSYTFGRKVLNQRNGLTEYELPCGCMLYINRKCLDIVGGFDTDFEGYSYEHVNYSQRVFNAGLTPARFLDVTLSKDYIYSMDEHKQIVSSVSQLDRGLGIQANWHLFMKNRDSKEWKPYK
jgi:GT2 family glycosyltransferase